MNLFHEIEVADWKPALDGTLIGNLLVSKYVITQMLKQEPVWGRIIMMGSGRGRGGGIRMSLGSMFKASLVAWTRCVAHELAPQGITVNCIAPGPIMTPHHINVLKLHQKADQTYQDNVPPIGRVGEPEDIADLVAYITSDQASYITGETVNVRGLKA